MLECVENCSVVTTGTIVSCPAFSQISRALKAYDRLVLAVRAPPTPKSRRWRLAITFSLFLVAEAALVWYMVKTKDDTVMSYVVMFAGTFISLAGFRSVSRLRDTCQTCH